VSAIGRQRHTAAQAYLLFGVALFRALAALVLTALALSTLLVVLLTGFLPALVLLALLALAALLILIALLTLILPTLLALATLLVLATLLLLLLLLLLLPIILLRMAGLIAFVAHGVLFKKCLFGNNNINLCR
jgi:hypothetical protein